MSNKMTTILCSGVALGVYIPAMLLNHTLRKEKVLTDVVVLENLIMKEKKDKINDNKKAFHNSFAVALKGQKMARDIRPSLDEDIVQSLFEQWEREKRKDFIIFSGFWLPIIEDYLHKTGYTDSRIDLCHMDADYSASWKNYKNICSKYNNIWLFSWEEKCVHCEIAITDKVPVPYEQRHNRFVIHGGGWGMGTYQSKIPQLEKEKIPLDIVIYDMCEAENKKEQNRYFMVSPDWSPWMKNDAGEHEFPYFGQVLEAGEATYKNRKAYHELFDIIRYDKAIISKPGGATLLDSLASATPIIMLDSFGAYEHKNMLLWEHMGFGIRYEEWERSNFSMDMLEGLHDNLMGIRGALLDYGRAYATKNRNENG